MNQQTRINVQEYYGKTLQTSDDLKTSACCPAEAPPLYVQALLRGVHDDVQAKFYGCGSPLPLAVQGCTVLDLGCGSGRDAYVLSQLVGAKGSVIGVDMTDEQLAVAVQYRDWHMQRFGYATPNVEFRQGYIEDLASAGLADNSVDVVVSNCVINLSPAKDQVFSEIFRVLKPGGELYFSDVFSGRRVPEALRTDKVLHGECLAGALYTEDFRRMMARLGFQDVRIMSKRLLEIEDPDLYAKAGMIDFYSITVRAFKLPLEDICENYGHVATYKGTVAQQPHAFVLDDHHTFKTGLPVAVCGNTADMLSKTRFAEHFDVQGDFSVHYGVFDCAPTASDAESAVGCC